jgi:transcription antitermination protein NusB
LSDAYDNNEPRKRLNVDTQQHIVTRRIVRERVMQVLYAYEISKEPIQMLVESIAGEDLERDPEQFKFAQNLIYASLNHRAESEALISEHTRNWEMSRIASIDHVLLGMGITEFLYFPDIPPKVTINECVEVAKRYSTEQSGKFINGVLNAILERLVAEGRVRKAGRGLID